MQTENSEMQVEAVTNRGRFERPLETFSPAYEALKYTFLYQGTCFLNLNLLLILNRKSDKLGTKAVHLL